MSTTTGPVSIQGEILVAGDAGSGPALVLSAPISFWGGVDPKSGTIADVLHPEHGRSVAGSVLFLPGTIGSSSASENSSAGALGSGRRPAAIITLSLMSIISSGCSARMVKSAKSKPGPTEHPTSAYSPSGRAACQ